MNYEKMQSSRRSTRPSTRKWSFLVGARILRRENGIISSERAFSGEKMQSSRRSTRPSTRKRNHVVGARIVRRENGIMSSERAFSGEKTESSRRSTRPSTRKRNHLVRAPIVRRENGSFSPEHALVVEKKLSSAQPDRELKTCTHREFNSDYRGGCSSFAERKFSFPRNLWRGSRSRRKYTSGSAGRRLRGIFWWISRSGPRRMPSELNSRASVRR